MPVRGTCSQTNSICDSAGDTSRVYGWQAQVGEDPQTCQWLAQHPNLHRLKGTSACTQHHVLPRVVGHADGAVAGLKPHVTVYLQSLTKHLMMKGQAGSFIGGTPAALHGLARHHRGAQVAVLAHTREQRPLGSPIRSLCT